MTWRSRKLDGLSSRCVLFLCVRTTSTDGTAYQLFHQVNSLRKQWTNRMGIGAIISCKESHNVSTSAFICLEITPWECSFCILIDVLYNLQSKTQVSIDWKSKLARNRRNRSVRGQGSYRWRTEQPKITWRLRANILCINKTISQTLPLSSNEMNSCTENLIALPAQVTSFPARLND